MKKITILLIILFSNLALADNLTWNELEAGQKYTVANDIPFNENLTLKADSPLYFSELITGPVPVIMFSFQDPNCTDTNFESEMVLFNPEPEDTDHDKSIALQYSKECFIDIYVEPKFFYNKSIFNQ